MSLSHAAACIGCAYPKSLEAKKKATPGGNVVAMDNK